MIKIFSENLNLPKNKVNLDLKDRKDEDQLISKTGAREQTEENGQKENNMASELEKIYKRTNGGDPNVTLVKLRDEKAIEVSSTDGLEQIILTPGLNGYRACLVYTEHSDGTRNAVLTCYSSIRIPNKLLDEADKLIELINKNPKMKEETVRRVVLIMAPGERVQDSSTKEWSFRIQNPEAVKFLSLMIQEELGSKAEEILVPYSEKYIDKRDKSEKKGGALIVSIPPFGKGEASYRTEFGEEILSKQKSELIPKKLEKRFRLSPEKFAKKRIKAIKEVVRGLKEKYPEILSFCLFGSTVTGGFRPESDIDGLLFADAEKIAEEMGRDQSEILQVFLERRGESNYYFKKDKKLKILNYDQDMGEKLKERLNLSDRQVAHIRKIPISKYIIDQSLKKFIEQIKREEDYKKEIENYEKGDQRFCTSAPPFKSFPGFNIFRMFHLETGGGIKKYRKYLLNQLIDLGEEGERAWREIIREVEYSEHGHTDRFRERIYKRTYRYPRTLEEARKVYG